MLVGRLCSVHVKESNKKVGFLKVTIGGTAARLPAGPAVTGVGNGSIGNAGFLLSAYAVSLRRQPPQNSRITFLK